MDLKNVVSYVLSTWPQLGLPIGQSSIDYEEKFGDTYLYDVQAFTTTTSRLSRLYTDQCIWAKTLSQMD